MTELSLGFSPCPNDTFVFHALVHGLVRAEGIVFRERLEDVETLNRLAAGRELDVAKVSYGALPLLADYELLRSGGALGRGCGPLLVAKPGTPLEALRRSPIAIPGRHTTANLLLRLWDPRLPDGAELLYSEILPAVARGDYASGLIIHESRFTYLRHGLVEIVDLGRWWEQETGLPIPLGAIVARRGLGAELVRRVETAIRQSVEYAFANPDASREYVRSHGQEMNESVIREHIALYVNQYSVDLGDDGERAVEALLSRARAAGPSLGW